MGAKNPMNRFIPNLANLCVPLRPLLKKDKEWKWQEKAKEAFRKMKQATKEITEIKHFERNLPFRIICDASQKGLGQSSSSRTMENGKQPIMHRAFYPISRKNSIIELELLAVV